MAHHQQGEGVLRLPARAGDRHARRLRGSRPVPLLPVLGSDSRPDVLPHRDVGLRPPYLRRDEVLPVHARGIPSYARRDHLSLPRLRGRDLRARGSVRHTPFCRHAALVVPRLLRFLRGEGAVGAVPHVAPGRAYRSPDRRLGDAGRCAPEDGGLWARPFRHPAGPGRGPRFRAADHDPRDHRDHLRSRGGDRPEGPQTPHRVLVRCSPRVRGARSLRGVDPGDERRDPADGEPRHLDGRSFHAGRRPLRPEAQERIADFGGLLCKSVPSCRGSSGSCS